jgi:hypothetical protein
VQNLIADTLLCLQHPPVYTLGKRGVHAHFKVSEDKVLLTSYCTFVLLIVRIYMHAYDFRRGEGGADVT